MTLTSIDATISDERRNVDVNAYAKVVALLRKSTEFYRLLEKAVSLGLHNEPGDYGRRLDLVNASMCMGFWLGYQATLQEQGAKELEAFFGETAVEESQAIRASTYTTKKG